MENSVHKETQYMRLHSQRNCYNLYMRISDSDIVSFLVDAGLVSRKDISYAQNRADTYGQDVSSVLLHDGLISEDDVVRMQSMLLGIPRVDLSEVKVPHTVLLHIPEPIARTHRVVAFKDDTDTVHVALKNIESMHVVTPFFEGKTCVPHFTNDDSLTSVLRQYQDYLRNEFGSRIKKESSLLEHILTLPEENISEDSLIKHPALEHVVEALFQHALVSKAHVIHIEEREANVIMKYRIRGKLYEAFVLPGYMFRGIRTKIASLAGIRKGSEQYDGRFGMTYHNERISCRVTMFPTYTSEKISIKLIKAPANGFTLEGLGFTPFESDVVYDFLAQRRGLIFVGGDVHAGTTTCLYTLLDLLEDGHTSIATLEDSIEYRLPHITQTILKGESVDAYRHGLRMLKKGDSDVVMVSGDIPSEVYEDASALADRGVCMIVEQKERTLAHMVHDIKNVVKDTSVPVLCIAPRLLRTLPKEKESYNLTDAEIKELKKKARLDIVLQALHRDSVLPKEVADWREINFYKLGDRHTEYNGYTGIYEVVYITPHMKDVLSKHKTVASIENDLYGDDVLTHLELGIYKAVAGVVSLEEVLGSEIS